MGRIRFRANCHTRRLNRAFLFYVDFLCSIVWFIGLLLSLNDVFLCRVGCNILTQAQVNARDAESACLSLTCAPVLQEESSLQLGFVQALHLKVQAIKVILSSLLKPISTKRDEYS